MPADGPAARVLSAVLLVVAWVATWRPALDPDGWWHVALGERILASGAIPTVEPWSWWSAGREILAHSWAWDVVLASAASAGGLLGVSGLGAVVGGLAVALLWWLLRLSAPEVPGILRSGLVVAAVVSAVVFWSPRAQLVDLVAVLAIAIVVERYARIGRAMELAALPVIALLWANLHGSAAPGGLIVGLVVGVTGLVIGARRGHWPARPLVPLVVAGVAALAALVVNPAGIGLLTYPLDAAVASAFARDIVEWLPPDLTSPGLWPFALAVVAAVVAVVVPGRRPRDPLVVLLAVAWTGLALISARFVLIAGPLLVVAAGPIYASLVPVRAAAAPVTGRSLAVLRAASLVAVGAIVLVGWTLIAPGTQDRLVAATFPVRALAAIEDADCDGRLLNAYDWGGFVIARGDGREVGAYGNSPGDVVATQGDLEAMRIDPAPFLEEHAIGLTLLKADGPLAGWFRTAPGWQVALDDGQALVAVPADDPGCQILVTQ